MSNIAYWAILIQIFQVLAALRHQWKFEIPLYTRNDFPLSSCIDDDAKENTLKAPSKALYAPRNRLSSLFFGRNWSTFYNIKFHELYPHVRQLGKLRVTAGSSISTSC